MFVIFALFTLKERLLLDNVDNNKIKIIFDIPKKCGLFQNGSNFPEDDNEMLMTTYLG